MMHCILIPHQSAILMKGATNIKNQENSTTCLTDYSSVIHVVSVLQPQEHICMHIINLCESDF